ncbi:Nephrocystin-4 [Allomyces javanicus]|nr:Nephrocystin-4 [Allomyces javanicus]
MADFIDQVLANSPLPFVSEEAAAGAPNASIQLTLAAVRALPISDAVWQSVAEYADGIETVTETDSDTADEGWADDEADPKRQGAGGENAGGRRRRGGPNEPVVPLPGIPSLHGVAVVGVTLSWFDGVVARPFGASYSDILAIVYDESQHDNPGVIQQLISRDVPLVQRSAPLVSLELYEKPIFSLVSPYIKHVAILAEFFLQGNGQSISLAWCPIPVFHVPEDHNLPLIRGSLRGAFLLKTPIDFSTASLNYVSGSALSLRVLSDLDANPPYSRSLPVNVFTPTWTHPLDRLEHVVLGAIRINSTTGLQMLDSAVLAQLGVPGPESASIEERRLSAAFHNTFMFVSKVVRGYPQQEGAQWLQYDDLEFHEVAINDDTHLLLWLEYLIDGNWITAAWDAVAARRFPKYSDHFELALRARPFLPGKKFYNDPALRLPLHLTIDVSDFPPSPVKAKAAPVVQRMALDFAPNSEPELAASASRSGHFSRTGQLPEPVEQQPDQPLAGEEEPPGEPVEQEMPDQPATPAAASTSEFALDRVDSSVSLVPQEEGPRVEGLTRQQMARLLIARYPPDHVMHEILSAADPIMDKEVADPLVVNRVSILVMALSWISKADPPPTEVQVALSFFNFDKRKSPTLHMRSRDGDSNPWPTVLYAANSPTANDGYLEKFDVALENDVPFLSVARYRMSSRTPAPPVFVQYLAQEQLEMEVWCARSLMLLGIVKVPLAGLLRQGRPRAGGLVPAPIFAPTEQGSHLGHLFVTLTNQGSAPDEPSWTSWADIYSARHATHRVGDFREVLNGRKRVALHAARHHPLSVPQQLSLAEKRAQYVTLLGEVRAARDQKKHSEIAKVLHHVMTTHYRGHVIFGCSHFFEFHISNPRNAQALYKIVLGDSNVRILTEQDELCVFGHNDESAVVHRQGNQCELLLAPLESKVIPMLFTAVNRGTEIITSIGVHDVHSGKAIVRLEASFQVHPHPVHSTLTFFVPGNEYFRHRIPLEHFASHPSEVQAIRCFDNDVYCSMEGSDIHVKVRAAREVGVRDVCLFAFADPYGLELRHVCRVSLHGYQRIDLSGHVGQVTRAALIARGNDPVANVRCFSSSRDFTVPDGILALPAGGCSEVAVQYRPMDVGDQRVVVHLVDPATRKLVWGWIVQCRALPPVVTKTFQLTLPLGKPASKRISFSNPYGTTKVFEVSCSHHALVSVREDVFELAPGAAIYLHLAFAALDLATRVDVFIFINDPEGNSEECFCVKAVYQD